MSESELPQRATALVRNRDLYLSFQSGGEEFAAPALTVREVLEFRAPRRVPRMPDYIAGVLNLRGAVIPVIDLGSLLAGRATQVERRTCIVILEAESPAGRRMSLGCIVERVHEVLNIEAEQIDEPPAFGARIDTRFLQGLARVSEERVVILLECGALGDFDELERLAHSNLSLLDDAGSMHADPRTSGQDSPGQASEADDDLDDPAQASARVQESTGEAEAPAKND